MNYLPVFVNLRSKFVLVVGGGIVSERKIQLLLKAGAKVNVLSDNLSPNLILLKEQNKIIWINDKFHEKYLKKIYLVIAATNNEILNQKIFEIANKKFILVNVVDDLEKCSFIFPSIVDRSPIIVAVSSSGTAPVLSRLIREKIEAILPFKLGNVANLAGKLRNTVKNFFLNCSDRRYFWEKIFNGSFVNYVLHNNLKLAIQNFYSEMKNDSTLHGELILVGAGPGDLGLLTLRGFQVLQQADVVLYDYLIQRDMLNLVRRDAQCICVGKRVNDKKSWNQKDINNLIVELVMKGKKVVRLKGGDSFIFGRGGEELEAIKKIGGNFQVVPGVTAAIGAASYAGIPLTHRQYSQNLFFVNAYSHDFSNVIACLSLSKLSYTIVIYMGRTKCELIVTTLNNHSFSIKTPIAVISQGTTMKQQVLIGTLSNLVELINQSTSPTILIIGKVVYFHDKLKWFNDINK
ncbi:Siroheme synthase [Buchnera aphidicola (Eriosoma lanigerum)]|uniref:siroheme synthase CysG n=1 Tax=Buchnera aphidicola TaxID=9 RepID=UPI00346480B6